MASSSPVAVVIVAVGGGLPPGSFAASVPTIGDISADANSVGLSALLALLFLILAAFPGQLFNKTYEEHEEEIGEWFARGGRMLAGVRLTLSRFWNRRVGIFSFVLLSALLYGFLSPSFGPTAESIASRVGILVGLGVAAEADA